MREFNQMICEQCGTVIAPDSKECPICGTQIHSYVVKAVSEKSQSISKESKRNTQQLYIIFAALFLALAVGMVCFTMVYLRSDRITGAEPQSTIKDKLLQQMIEEHRYTDALNRINSIKGDNEEQLRTTVFELMSKEVQNLIDSGKYAESMALLETYDQLPNNDQLRESIYQKIQASIEESMNNGDYRSALEILFQNKDAPFYAPLYKLIKDETIALSCLLNVKPKLKNPSSIQITEVRFFDNSNLKFPNVVINVSAQNGFGGYSTRYFLFSPADLTVLGSCPTLNVNDYDMNDEEELLERIICAMITSFKTELPVSYDMNRLNLILASGKTPKTDLSKFANNGKSA